jgi:hypothetical protein
MIRVRAVLTGRPLSLLTTVTATAEYAFPDQGPPTPQLVYATRQGAIAPTGKVLAARWDDPTLTIWVVNAPPNATIPVRLTGRRNTDEYYILSFPAAPPFSVGYAGQVRGGAWDAAAGVLTFTLP